MSELRKKPWNRVDQPVYSIASAWQGNANMNICTYAVPVSLKPKLYVVALYRNTFTLELVGKRGEFLLQLLERKQYRLVARLGKTSGRNTHKLSSINEPVEWHHGLPYLSRALAFVHLKVVRCFDTGDHLSTVCRVLTFRNLNHGIPLTTRYLKLKNIIRS
ncbi:MAG: hypothetical protein KatS3mg032_2184 [Cyclobacteriaceae bacterium]|nr:MAG: hypothetical protein KatS3mg032_2184 [Cyclobacteriaceae bacterium]